MSLSIVEARIEGVCTKNTKEVLGPEGEGRGRKVEVR